MFGKMLASIGIGGAKVDARVPNTPVRPGDMLSGEIHIKGGGQEQHIKKISMALTTRYQYQTDDGNIHHADHELTCGDVAENVTVRPGAELVFPFEFEVPAETPTTTDVQQVYLRTGLDIAMAVDPSDTDEIEVHPDELAEAVLAEAEDLGFEHTHRSGICHRSHYHDHVPFRQEFELTPRSGAYRGRLEEIQLVFDVHPEGVAVMVQVDRRAGLLSEMLDTDEHFVELQIQRAEGYRKGSLDQLIRDAMGRH